MPPPTLPPSKKKKEKKNPRRVSKRPELGGIVPILHEDPESRLKARLHYSEFGVRHG